MWGGVRDRRKAGWGPMRRHCGEGVWGEQEMKKKKKLFEEETSPSEPSPELPGAEAAGAGKPDWGGGAE